MASFNTGVALHEVMEQSEKAYHVVVPRSDGVDAPYWISKRLCQWKDVGGKTFLFVQTWYAKQIGL